MILRKSFCHKLIYVLSSPAKRSPEKSEDESSGSAKRVRLETAPPPLLPDKPVKPDGPEGEADAKISPESLSPRPAAALSPPRSAALSPPRSAALSPPRSSEASNFVFGENLTDRADNFSSAAAAASPSFVFGQNLTERAENFSPEPSEPAAMVEEKSDQPSPKAPAPVTDPKSPPKSLTESAAAYYESHAMPKRKYDEVCVRRVDTRAQINSF
jgi:hypothetical protein